MHLSSKNTCVFGERKMGVFLCTDLSLLLKCTSLLPNREQCSIYAVLDCFIVVRLFPPSVGEELIASNTSILPLFLSSYARDNSFLCAHSLCLCSGWGTEDCDGEEA